jgi:hypothetical protein
MHIRKPFLLAAITVIAVPLLASPAAAAASSDGWNIKNIYLSYDSKVGTLYVGVNNVNTVDPPGCTSSLTLVGFDESSGEVLPPQTFSVPCGLTNATFTETLQGAGRNAAGDQVLISGDLTTVAGGGTVSSAEATATLTEQQ